MSSKKNKKHYSLWINFISLQSCQGFHFPRLSNPDFSYSSVGVRLKVGDKYWEEWRGGVWRGTVPSCVGGLGLSLEKKINFALKIMQFWANFGTSFLYCSLRTYQRIRESGGGLSPVLKVGDLSPDPLLRRLCFLLFSYLFPWLSPCSFIRPVENHGNYLHFSR